MPTLSRGAQRCLDALRYFARGKDHCWPKQQTLARHMKCGLRSVKRYLEELRLAGAVTSNRRPNTSCLYQLQASLALPETFGTSVGTSVALPPYITERKSLKGRCIRLDELWPKPPQRAESLDPEVERQFWERYDREMALPLQHKTAKGAKA